MPQNHDCASPDRRPCAAQCAFRCTHHVTQYADEARRSVLTRYSRWRRGHGGRWRRSRGRALLSANPWHLRRPIRPSQGFSSPRNCPARCGAARVLRACWVRDDRKRDRGRGLGDRSLRGANVGPVLLRSADIYAWEAESQVILKWG